MWLGWTVVQVVTAARELQQGQRRAEVARRAVTPDALRSGAVADALTAASRPFGTAERRLRQPALAPARLLPVVGRQLRAMAALGGAGADATEAGARAARQVQAVLGEPPSTGSERLALLARLRRTTETLDGDLARLDLGPRNALVPALARGRNDVAAALEEARAAADGAGSAIGAVETLLRGPSRHLVLAANNAEMRAGTGMYLSVGVLRSEGGDLDLSDLQRTSSIVVPDPGVAPDGDLADRWGWTNPGREWRNLGMTPRFDANAELARRMWAASTGDTVDGVLTLDVLALARILAATGPVELDGAPLDADRAVPFLLNEQYDGLDDDDDQAERRERLGELAALVVRRVQEGTFDVELLASGLMTSVQRRNLMVWSPDAPTQAGWRAAGAAGELDERSLMVSVLNRAGNKLDWFLRIDNEVRIERAGGGTVAALRIRLQNRASGDEPRYVLGPARGLDLPRGEYVGLLTINAPRGSELVGIDGGFASVRGPDGPTEVVATEVRIPSGGTTEVVVRLRLPSSLRSVRVEPSARESPARWSVDGRRFRDHRPHEVEVAATDRGGAP